MPTVDMVFALEQCTQSKTGRSMIIQAFAGFFVWRLLVHVEVVMHKEPKTCVVQKTP